MVHITKPIYNAWTDTNYRNFKQSGDPGAHLSFCPKHAPMTEYCFQISMNNFKILNIFTLIDKTESRKDNK